MKERPILFSAPMVRALLDGSKTQTRRLVKMPASWDCIVYADWGNGMWPFRSDDGESPNYDNNEIRLACPYGQPGDRLWVRETHRAIWGQSPGYLIGVDYQADDPLIWTRMRDHHGRPQWTPSIHMRREYSRILLEVVSVRVQRLQDISEADAIAEGAKRFDSIPMATAATDPNRWSMESPENTDQCLSTARLAFANYLCRVNTKSKRGPLNTQPWDENEWVWVVEFKRVTP